MASTRLSDAHRQELVARYQQGETAQALADAFGCSAATATRVVKAAIGAERYEQIKLERGKGPSGRRAATAATHDAIATPSGPLFEQAKTEQAETQSSRPAAAAAGPAATGESAADQDGSIPGSFEPSGAEEATSELSGLQSSSSESPEGDASAAEFPYDEDSRSEVPGAKPSTAEFPDAEHFLPHPSGTAESGADSGSERPDAAPLSLEAPGSAASGLEASGFDSPYRNDGESRASYGSGFAPASQGEPSGQDPAADADADADADVDDDSQVLAIDDADDFAEEADENDADADSDGEDVDDELDLFTPVPVGETLIDRPAATCQPFEAAPLPASLYMLVDKTVELQDRPLSDFPELGLLPEEESQRRALVVFSNPRQAKRHCGRTQRVIQVPDSQVIRRTAPYLLRKGITRVVLEGALYSLPGS